MVAKNDRENLSLTRNVDLSLAEHVMPCLSKQCSVLPD